MARSPKIVLALVFVSICFLVLLTLCCYYGHRRMQKKGYSADGTELCNKKLSALKVAFVTAVYGNYEATCKPIVKQSIPADFICFTNNKKIIAKGWQIDTTQYHETIVPAEWRSDYHNAHNKHTFCIAKYYKQSFHLIPRLQKYDVIIWLDGTIAITHADAAKVVRDAVNVNSIVTCFNHEYRGRSSDSMLEEARASVMSRYLETNWLGQKQPVQDTVAHRNTYVAEGYSQAFFGAGMPSLWITCFVGFNMRNRTTRDLLKLWYLQTLMHTTQDQISFPYACWKLGVVPHTLQGDTAHEETYLYKKHVHGL